MQHVISEYRLQEGTQQAAIVAYVGITDLDLTKIVFRIENGMIMLLSAKRDAVLYPGEF
jgi:hypothetical protein